LQYKDFTTDPVNFPANEMRDFIDKVHSQGRHYGELMGRRGIYAV